MSTKYNPYSAINAIFNYKGEWDKANAAGDSTKKSEAAKKAQAFYEQLRANGYGDVADTLSQSNYTQAKYINDYYKSLAEAAKPRETTTAIAEENEKLFANYNREYEDLKSTNPFETAEGKAILAKYDLAGLQGRDNQAAVGGANNGGNIDSYAAANAQRQQAALVNQGQQTVLSAYQQKLDHARSLLADMGVNISRVHEDNETSKQNDFAIEAEKARISGYTPSSWIEGATNPYLNADGTLKSEYLTEEFDNTGGFATIIANAEKAGNAQAVQFAKEARAKKIFGNYAKYAKYDDGNYTHPTPQRTSEHELAEKQIASAEKVALDGNRTTENVAAAESMANLYGAKPNLTAAQAKQAIEDGIITDETVAAYNYHFGTNLTTQGGPGNVTGGGSWEDFISSFEDEKVTEFLNFYLKPYYDSGKLIDEDVIEKLIVGDNVLKSNSTTYDLDTEKVKAICSALGLDYSWVDEKYTNRWGVHSEKGMKLK